MKPVRLTMQAFGPYSEQETIDFRDAVDAGLFGIYGQTGSGKSTIFSAMTFALFGEAAKAEQETPSLRSDNADANRPTEVEFVFDIADRRYVVRRRPEQSRPKQRGNGETRDPHEAWLFDATGMALDDITPERPGKVIEEKKVGPVGKAIEDLLGYGADQFRQIVLLPQGRFEAFLAADTKARLGILRDLFDVSLYRRLAARMKADAEAVERQFRTEREVFARRLNAEGFESLDALKSGIEESETSYSDLAKVEINQREAQKKAYAALEAAKALDRLFETAIKASNEVTALQQQASEIDAIAKSCNPPSVLVCCSMSNGMYWRQQQSWLQQKLPLVYRFKNLPLQPQLKYAPGLYMRMRRPRPAKLTNFDVKLKRCSVTSKHLSAPSPYRKPLHRQPINAEKAKRLCKRAWMQLPLSSLASKGSKMG
ncbi:SMC family ATPase [Ochrobactrum haematophilum]|uniref:SMC family ATPase n=1 Tax=Brucella haematophila TaxID=419474 RepID=A0ABX1DR19_9HYPH|nr:SMC family ATPase [Brucella haematophila]